MHDLDSKRAIRDSLVVSRLGDSDVISEGPGSIPGWETKILCNWCGVAKKKKKVKVHSDYPADFRVVEGYSESRRTNL